MCQQQALMGVHALGFTRGNAKEQGVKARDIIKEAAPTNIGLARFGFRIAHQRAPVPAIRRNFGDGAATCLQILPKCFDIARPRKSRADTDDSNGIVWFGCGRRPYRDRR